MMITKETENSLLFLYSNRFSFYDLKYCQNNLNSFTLFNHLHKSYTFDKIVLVRENVVRRVNGNRMPVRNGQRNNSHHYM